MRRKHMWLSLRDFKTCCRIKKPFKDRETARMKTGCRNEPEILEILYGLL
jgi:hypothetical protein